MLTLHLNWKASCLFVAVPGLKRSVGQDERDSIERMAGFQRRLCRPGVNRAPFVNEGPARERSGVMVGPGGWRWRWRWRRRGRSGGRGQGARARSSDITRTASLYFKDQQTKCRAITRGA
jgi:hypothetical protein